MRAPPYRQEARRAEEALVSGVPRRFCPGASAASPLARWGCMHARSKQEGGVKTGGERKGREGVLVGLGAYTYVHKNMLC